MLTGTNKLNFTATDKYVAKHGKVFLVKKTGIKKWQLFATPYVGQNPIFQDVTKKSCLAEADKIDLALEQLRCPNVELKSKPKPTETTEIPAKKHGVTVIYYNGNKMAYAYNNGRVLGPVRTKTFEDEGALLASCRRLLVKGEKIALFNVVASEFKNPTDWHSYKAMFLAKMQASEPRLWGRIICPKTVAVAALKKALFNKENNG